MSAHARPRLLLVGAGHAHAFVLEALAARPIVAAGGAAVDVAIVTPHRLAPYSGMVPGWMAKRYRFDEIAIDFAPLAARAGAAFVAGEVAAIDAHAREARLADGRRLGFDIVSLDIGSTLVPPVPPDPRTLVLPLRPLGELRGRWDALLALAPRAGRPLRLVIAGGGAAGVESALAAVAAWRAQYPGAPRAAVDAMLATRAATLLPELAPRAGELAAQALARAGVGVVTGRDVDDAMLDGADAFVWATGAQPHRWPQAVGVALDDAGFVAVDATLRSPSHPWLHAAGDCCGFAPPLRKAGVVAVRMGPVLAHNLRAAFDGSPRLTHVPQPRQLALLSTADGAAIGAWGPFAVEGCWLWRWKDRIDRAFVARFAADPDARAAAVR